MLIESLRKMRDSINDVIKEVEANKEALAELEREETPLVPKWREMVEKNNTRAAMPLSAVLYGMYAIASGDYCYPGLHHALARIVAVCEQQVPGWKAEPYESNDFSTFQLVSAFGSVLRNPAEPALRDWQALGEEAASWLKQLTENDDD